MKTEIHHLIEGARAATGVAVIIDVFRAFSVACYAFGNGAARMIPVGDAETAYRLKRENPAFLLIGEIENRIRVLIDGIVMGGGGDIVAKIA